MNITHILRYQDGSATCRIGKDKYMIDPVCTVLKQETAPLLGTVYPSTKARKYWTNRTVTQDVRKEILAVVLGIK